MAQNIFGVGSVRSEQGVAQILRQANNGGVLMYGKAYNELKSQLAKNGFTPPNQPETTYPDGSWRTALWTHEKSGLTLRVEYKVELYATSWTDKKTGQQKQGKRLGKRLNLFKSQTSA